MVTLLFELYFVLLKHLVYHGCLIFISIDFFYLLFLKTFFNHFYRFQFSFFFFVLGVSYFSFSGSFFVSYILMIRFRVYCFFENAVIII